MLKIISTQSIQSAIDNDLYQFLLNSRCVICLEFADRPLGFGLSTDKSVYDAKCLLGVLKHSRLSPTTRQPVIPEKINRTSDDFNLFHVNPFIRDFKSLQTEELNELLKKYSHNHEHILGKIGSYFCLMDRYLLDPTLKNSPTFLNSLAKDFISQGVYLHNSKDSILVTRLIPQIEKLIEIGLYYEARFVIQTIEDYLTYLENYLAQVEPYKSTIRRFYLSLSRFYSLLGKYDKSEGLLKKAHKNFLYPLGILLAEPEKINLWDWDEFVKTFSDLCKVDSDNVAFIGIIESLKNTLSRLPETGVSTIPITKLRNELIKAEIYMFGYKHVKETNLRSYKIQLHTLKDDNSLSELLMIADLEYISGDLESAKATLLMAKSVASNSGSTQSFLYNFNAIYVFERDRKSLGSPTETQAIVQEKLKELKELKYTKKVRSSFSLFIKPSEQITLVEIANFEFQFDLIQDLHQTLAIVSESNDANLVRTTMLFRIKSLYDYESIPDLLKSYNQTNLFSIFISSLLEYDKIAFARMVWDTCVMEDDQSTLLFGLHERFIRYYNKNFMIEESLSLISKMTNDSDRAYWLSEIGIACQSRSLELQKKS